jgi:hypothetical protein
MSDYLLDNEIEDFILEAFNDADIQDTIFMKNDPNTTLYEEILERINKWYRKNMNCEICKREAFGLRLEEINK